MGIEGTKMATLGSAVFQLIAKAIRNDERQIEVASIADIAVQVGLIQVVPYDSLKHGILEDVEVGDLIYHWES